jgi:hypothetical protein
MTWPKLIGSAVGCVGIGSCIMLSAYFFTTPRYMDMLLFVGFCGLSVVSVALVALSHFLWRGRSWALSTLVVLCWILAFSLVVVCFAGMLRETVHTSDIIGGLGELIAMASPPLWFAVMLRQPDIVRAFAMHQTRLRSSQPLAVAMTRFDFMKEFKEFATLAPASGGSAPSR